VFHSFVSFSKLFIWEGVIKTQKIETTPLFFVPVRTTNAFHEMILLSHERLGHFLFSNPQVVHPMFRSLKMKYCSTGPFIPDDLLHLQATQESRLEA
jgi:hypothetical protein